MSKPAFTTVLGLCLVVAYASSVPAATPGLRDAANMFPENTLRQADERLTELYRKHGWEIVFETIDTLDGKSIDRVTEDKARSLQVHGVYFLIAKKEHKVHYWIEQPALNTFDKAAVESATQKIIGGFKRKKFDEGLLNAVNYLADVGERGPSATTKGLARSAPATSRPDLAPRTDRNTDINLSLNRSYSRGQKVKFLGKESTIKSSVQLGLTGVYSRVSGETIKAGTSESQLRVNQDRLSLNGTGSYSFSNNVTGSVGLGFGQNRDIVRDAVSRNVRVELRAAFTF